MRLENVHDRAQLDTMAAYAARRDPAGGQREVDIRKLQLQMDPTQQAAEGRQQVGAAMLPARFMTAALSVLACVPLCGMAGEESTLCCALQLRPRHTRAVHFIVTSHGPQLSPSLCSLR